MITLVEPLNNGKSETRQEEAETEYKIVYKIEGAQERLYIQATKNRKWLLSNLPKATKDVSLMIQCTCSIRTREALCGV